jgi:anthranilate synthase component 2
MILIIDNFDSFTYNLVHYFGQLGVESVVRRNNAITIDEAVNMSPEAIILSPGPCDPDKAGICLEIIKNLYKKVPMLGVCLGHQAIAQSFGTKIIRAPIPMHGKASPIHHNKKGIFLGLPQEFMAIRYHSLIVDRGRLADCLDISAETEDGLIMGISHKKYPVFGVQFHPESIDTESGKELLLNFINLARKRRSSQ